MKKTIFSLFAAFSIHAMVAQTNTATPDYGNGTPLSTPNTITNRFNADYPNNNPMWTSEGSTYRADYTDGATSMGHAVIYDNDGNVISNDDQLANSTYPAPITEYYAKNYPDEKYQVWSSTDKSGNVTYYTSRDSETLWFDSNGKYKSKTTKAKSKTKTQAKKTK